MSERTHCCTFIDIYVCSYYWFILLLHTFRDGLTCLLSQNRIFCFLIYLSVKTELSADPVIALQQLSPLELIAKAVPFVKRGSWT